MYKPQHLGTSSAREIAETLRLVVAGAKFAERRGRGSRDFDVDFERCTKVDPGGLLLLLYVARSLYPLRKSVRVQGNTPVFREVLEHVAHYHLPKEKRKQLSLRPGDYLLRGLDDQDDMVDELADWGATVQGKTRARDEDIAEWQMQIGEAVVNGFQHGPTHLDTELPDILVVGKAYDDHQVQLATLDEGSGIPTVIKSASGCPASLDDGGLIRFACKPQVTSRCDRTNQGAGLATLVRAVQQNHGFLGIVSGDGFAHVTNGRIYSRDLAPLSPAARLLRGTLTVFQLRMRAP